MSKAEDFVERATAGLSGVAKQGFAHLLANSLPAKLAGSAFSAVAAC